MLQITSEIMMVRPANFMYNEQTAENNTFQTKDSKAKSDSTAEKAIEEFDAMVATLRSKGVNVTVVQDTEEPIKPDAVFPNNWISFHENGAVVTYPMFAENRRIERRESIIEEVAKYYEVSRRYSFEHYEDDGVFLEGTGSMLFDRVNNLVYASISDRTDVTLIDKFCVLMGSTRAVFHSYDKTGELIYHTNVMMALGKDFVVICMESIKDEEEKTMLLQLFEKTGKDIIEINQDQVENFAGNMLQVLSTDGESSYLVMSSSAYECLTSEQIEKLSTFTNLLPVAIPTIEHYGGGSVRCMMAEVFLPKKNS